MGEGDGLAERFEEHRGRLRAVAYRMLGSPAEADDAVQETWLRLSRSGADGIANLGGWLTTVTARVCLDLLRSRASRREQPYGLHVPDQAVGHDDTPEQEALLAASVGLALLVVLDRLAPAERVAFVLHDMFDLPFDQIAAILERSPNAARLLASRARRRVRGVSTVPSADLTRQRRVVDAFIAASRAGDFDALLALLDPDVVVRADRAAVPAGRPMTTRGSAAVAEQALAYSQVGEFARPALVNGVAGIIVAPPRRPPYIMAITIKSGRITEMDVITDPDRFRRLDLAVLGD
ncbi:sigma-70 family RNA polymerase sigma factor [Actinomadura scrupuli]|uniref:sigma-70 family RNA polymerase sigma factor n=1 Tax=Actinomadura scrupuli TaxID=559629 RepID=UPI003D96D330